MDRTKGPHIFGAITGEPLKKDGAFARSRKLAGRANAAQVKASHLRDGAYTAAVAAAWRYANFWQVIPRAGQTIMFLETCRWSRRRVKQSRSII
jgi:hypothetical protein